jgi:hypothetical protein
MKQANGIVSYGYDVAIWVNLFMVQARCKESVREICEFRDKIHFPGLLHLLFPWLPC